MRHRRRLVVCMLLLLMHRCLPLSSSRRRIAVIGGGASGIFSAISAAEHSSSCIVTVLEATSKTLAKVKISGGGRCNVLHDASKPVTELLQGYPRGYRELNGLYHKRFSPMDARRWFESRGVVLKTESDGRMFPTTDSSQTIVDILLRAANENDVRIRTKCKVQSIIKSEDVFQIVTNDEMESFDAVILATGSAPVGYTLAQSLGHSLAKPVASLFTLSTKHDVQENGLLHGLSGVACQAQVSFQVASASKKLKVISQQGPLLITHHGLSGPAALRLSSFGALEFEEANYRGPVYVHWAPTLGNAESIADLLWTSTSSNPKKSISTACPLVLEDGAAAIPKRLWASLVAASGLSDTLWGEASKKMVRKLAAQIAECRLEMTSKGIFKEEFVTAGGIPLKEVNMADMQSKRCPGLFACGEVLNVDGVTGGYNFMNCWGTGYVAGLGASEYVEGLSTLAL